MNRSLLLFLLALSLLFVLPGCGGGQADDDDDTDDDDSTPDPADTDDDGDGLSENEGDCDDTDAAISPNESEATCDGVDNDCDPGTPDDIDGDADGVLCSTDCDDSDAANFPGNTEICDGSDNDCDGNTWATGGETDGDGDGSLACADCDDSDGANYPGNAELCDGADNDCNGLDDMGLPGVAGEEADDDGDGQSECQGDCDDADATSTVVADDGDCDGVLTGDDCDDTDPTTVDDMDCDGVLTADDCDDTDATSTVVADDGDCDGVLTGDDCDDTDPTTVDDMDCDGVLTVDDCDDTDAGVGFLCGPVLPAGTFTMGCTAGQSSCAGDESPAHSVTLSHDFWMGETEVTQAHWQAQIGNNPSWRPGCGADCPVEAVNWYEALAFANAVSASEGLTECYSLSGCTNTVGNGMECSSVTVTSFSGLVTDCEGYRLPTEAEWEYAARGGQDLLYSGSNTIGNVAWYGSNSGSTTHPVATLQPNAWGLYDMSGNVWEWTWDRYSGSYYSNSPSTDPEGPNSGSYRVRRGGSWSHHAGAARVANRYNYVPHTRYDDLGFRLSRTIP